MQRAVDQGLIVFDPVRQQTETEQRDDDEEKNTSAQQRQREFNFEVQFPIKNQAAFRSSSKTTCGCLNPKHLRG
ncbi:hypothetical protein, partial [Aeromonas caviae]|uniref:hypothetical protein n=1 Tax=Aeromonas caviae TaxID=648 RepID=UPI001CC5F4F0